MDLANFQLMDMESPIRSGFSPKQDIWSNITSGSTTLSGGGRTTTGGGGGTNCYGCETLRCGQGTVCQEDASGCGSCVTVQSSPTCYGCASMRCSHGCEEDSGGCGRCLPAPETDTPACLTIQRINCGEGEEARLDQNGCAYCFTLDPLDQQVTYGGGVFGGGGGGGMMPKKKAKSGARVDNNYILGMRPVVFYGLLIVAGILLYRYMKKKK